MISEYRAIGMNATIDNSLTEFNQLVNDMIKQGWQPVGPVFMTADIPSINAEGIDKVVRHQKDPMWVQTMVKEHPRHPNAP